MRFIAHYSSSAGNLYEVVAANGKRLLIECGVTWKKLQKALKYDLSNIEGCLLTHEHKDHSRAIEDVLAAEIDVYASAGTFDALGVVHRKAHTIANKTRFRVGPFNVFPFTINHDAADPLGFVISTPFICDENLLFVTDTSHIKQKFGLAFSIIAICCNYDGDVLAERVKRGDIDETFAKRLLTSHMERSVTKKYLAESCCLDKCTEIWLLHCSRDNLNAEKTRAEIESEFFVKTIIAGKERK